MNNIQTYYIVIGLLVVAVIVLFAIGGGESQLGGLVHNQQEIYSNGLVSEGCIKMQDSDNGGYTYITSLDDNVTTSTASACGF